MVFSGSTDQCSFHHCSYVTRTPKIDLTKDAQTGTYREI